MTPCLVCYNPNHVTEDCPLWAFDGIADESGNADENGSERYEHSGR